PPPTAAQTLLDQRAAAVRAGDRDGFLATSSRDADAGALEEQEARFDRIQQLPPHSFDLTLSVTQHAAPGELTSYVNQAVQLKGIDEKPLGVVHRVTFGEHDGCWSVDADETEDIQVTEAPWEAPGAILEHREGVLLVTDEQDGSARDRILDAAVDAWQAERRLLATENHRPDDRGVVVLAFTTNRAMNVNGFYYRSLDLTGGIEVPVRTGTDEIDFRVLVAPSTLRDDSSTYLHTMLRHEFVHVLLARHQRAPTWATEGVAEYYSSGRAGGPVAPITDLVPPGIVTDGVGLPTDTFFADTWEERAGNYAVAWAAMTYLGEHFGTSEPARLVAVLHRVNAYRHPRRTEQVLERRYGLSVDDLGARARELVAAVG
ncbi:hypothetical protein ACFP8W_14205, partial [Nocardioides hankookensis]